MSTRSGRGVLMVAFGTRGDVVPALAVARSLSLLGNHVRVAVPTDFVPMVQEWGLEPVDLGVSACELLGSDLGRQWVRESGTGPRRALALLRDMFSAFGSVVADTLRSEHSPHEALASNLFTFGPAQALAEARHVPHVQLLLAPLTPSREPSSSIEPIARRSSRLNVLGGAIGLRALHWASRQVTDATRTSVGLGPWRAKDFVAAFSGTPVVYGVSPAVMPPDPRWPAHVNVTGFWFDPEPARAPATSVQDAVARAERPVYIGFGSMMDGLDRAAIERTVVSAALLAGVDPVLGVSPEDDARTDGVCYAPGVDHAWLFPRVQAAVHHGGAGTTAQALRAGIPSLAVPSLGDQRYWGRRLHELGVGPAPIERHRLTAAALGSAIREMLDNPRYRTHASAVACQLEEDSGAQQAAEHLRRLVGP